MGSKYLPLTFVFVLLLISSSGLAKNPEFRMSDDSQKSNSGKSQLTDFATADSILVMGPWGSGAAFNGQFQTPHGHADWNGWTHRDLTQPEGPNHWHVDSYHADGLAGHGPDNLAAWCGSLEFPPCSETDPEGGYGNNWADPLDWKIEVENPSLPSVVTIDAWINLDLEPGYDFLHLLLLDPDFIPNYTNIASYDGVISNQHLSWEINISPDEYSGPESNQIELRFIVESDGAWSDEDCLFSGAGACQLDDISVHVDNGNFNTIDDFQDGTLGSWTPGDFIGRGDFGQLRSNLNDLDDCTDNFSPQVCFIDDGIVVPGTGGSMCVDWCYGPEGYIVNPSGGLFEVFGYYRLYNAVLSPVMPWPENSDGGLLEFEAYVHEGLWQDSPGVFYGWHMRSTSSSDPADIEHESWYYDNYVYYGGPEYRTMKMPFSTYLESDARYVQVRLDQLQFDNVGWMGPNGTPAPYFDNVRVTAISTNGPAITLADINLANDAFPASGAVNLDDLASNSVRFDSTADLSELHSPYQAKDNIQIDLHVRGEGTELLLPKLHYRLIPNPLFDEVRSSGLPNTGYVEGAQGIESYQFVFDLPDTGFFYPGDVIHYYFSATQGTASGTYETATEPADTTGFSQGPWDGDALSPGLETYHNNYIVRALPGLRSGPNHAPLLVWDDSGDPEFTAFLRHDLRQSQQGTDYGGFDLYKRLSVSSRRPLAWSATPEVLAGYQAILYFSGSTRRGILGFYGEMSDADISLLMQWIDDYENRGMIISGDHILPALYTNHTYPLFQEYLGLQYVDTDLSPLIGGSLFPEVLNLQPDPFFLPGIDSWVINGHCPDGRIISAVQPAEGAVRIGEFAGPGGQGDYYPYSALNVFSGPNQSLFFTMPYDFRRISPPHGWTEGVGSLRSQLLMGLASHFLGAGVPWNHSSPVPDQSRFSASASPNPFNPATTIHFNLPHNGNLSLKIFNLRGELVRTLIDEPLLAGPGSVLWRGTNQNGNAVASGVYFYKLIHGDDALTEKLLLIK